METTALFVVLMVGVLLLLKSRGVDKVPATSDDWYVIFDIDAEHRIISLWFYPVVAIYGVGYEAKPITSNPSEANRLRNARKEIRIRDDDFGTSFSYGRWYRDGVSIDDGGKPDSLNSDDFSAYVARFLVEAFTLRYATAVPIKYQLQIQRVRQLADQENAERL